MNILAANGIDPWNEFLRTTDNTHNDLLESHRLQFAVARPDFPPVIFPPPLFDAEFLETASKVSLRLLDLLLSLPDRVFGGDIGKMLVFQGVGPDEAEFLKAFYTPRFVSMAEKFARADLLICRDGVKAVEMNIVPAVGGPGLCDRIAAEFQATSYFQYLNSNGIRVHAENTMDLWHKALMSLIRRKPNNRPLIFFEALITPWELDNQYPFKPDFLEPIRKFGFQVQTGLLQNLRVTTEGVFHDDIQIDVVYTMFAYQEIADVGLPKSIFLDLAKADEAMLVEYIAPPLGVVFDNKANFELLTSSEYAHFFSDDERAFITRYVPRTLRMTSALREDALNNQHNYVLKPTADFGGKSVHIGANVTREEWLECVELACANNKTFILQERIENIWMYRHIGAGVEQNWSVCLGPMMFDHCYSGSLIRALNTEDETPVINLNRGAALGTSFAATRMDIASF